MELEAPPQQPQQPQATTMSKVDYKSMLIQHVAKSLPQLPQYQTVNQGAKHAPQFKTAVTFDGETFESSTVFKNRKEAEQDASRVALEGIAEGLKTRGVLLVRNDTVLCKSILHDYAMKMKKEKPTYTSEEFKGILPSFVTSVTFDGNTYTGSQGKNKKEAEQIAARVAIESILGSGTGPTMSEIIKSKGRLYDAIPKGNGSVFVQDVGLTGHVDNHNIDSVAQAKERESAMAKDKLPNAPTCDSSDSQLTPSEAKQSKEELCELARINESGTSPVNLQQSDLTIAADKSAGICCSKSQKRRIQRKKSHAKRARTNGQVAQAKERESAMAKDKLPNAPTCNSSDSQLVNTSAVELVNTLAAKPTPSEAKKSQEELCELAQINESGTSTVNLQQSDLTVAADKSAGICCSKFQKRRIQRKKSHAKRARTDGQFSMFPEPAVQGTPVAHQQIPPDSVRTEHQSPRKEDFINDRELQESRLYIPSSPKQSGTCLPLFKPQPPTNNGNAKNGTRPPSSTLRRSLRLTSAQV